MGLVQRPRRLRRGRVPVRCGVGFARLRRERALASNGRRRRVTAPVTQFVAQHVHDIWAARQRVRTDFIPPCTVVCPVSRSPMCDDTEEAPVPLKYFICAYFICNGPPAAHAAACAPTRARLRGCRRPGAARRPVARARARAGDAGAEKRDWPRGARGGRRAPAQMGPPPPAQLADNFARPALDVDGAIHNTK